MEARYGSHVELRVWRTGLAGWGGLHGLGYPGEHIEGCSAGCEEVGV